MKISVINYSEWHRRAFDRDHRVLRVRVLHRSGKFTMGKLSPDGVIDHLASERGIIISKRCFFAVEQQPVATCRL